jgi:hypothetical protein
MNRRRVLSLVLLSSLFVVGLPAAIGFTLIGRRWVEGSAVFYTGMPGTLPSSTRTWQDALETAMQTWNDKTAFKFVMDKSYVDPCAGYTRSNATFPSGAGDRRNSAGFATTVCGNSFGDGVLAITLTTTQNNALSLFDRYEEADIIFNDNRGWDVYSGPRRSAIDFGRVALHELGHALGLDHESSAVSIMAPRISDMDTLQPDDITAANVLYGGQVLCPVTDLPLNAHVRNGLQPKDCRIKDLYGFGSDDSFVDVYKVKVTAPTTLKVDMRSTQMDPVIVLTDSKLRELDIYDDTPGSCNAHMEKQLAAGDYYVLANTYAAPRKCIANFGDYTLTITDSLQPQLGDSSSTTTATSPSALFTGGATADGGQSYKTSFAATDTIDIKGRIAIDPQHVGKSGRVIVLIRLSNGTSFTRNKDGAYIPFNGNLAQLASYKSGPLTSLEEIDVARGVRAEGTVLAGLSYAVFVGYALDSQPNDIFYGNSPIRFSIAE